MPFSLPQAHCFAYSIPHVGCPYYLSNFNCTNNGTYTGTYHSNSCSNSRTNSNPHNCPAYTTTHTTTYFAADRRSM
jgi:hypothetical protein